MKKRWLRSCWESTQNKVTYFWKYVRSDNLIYEPKYKTPVLCKPQRKYILWRSNWKCCLEVKHKFLWTLSPNRLSCSQQVPSVFVLFQSGTHFIVWFKLQHATSWTFKWAESLLHLSISVLSFSRWKPGLAVSARKRAGLLLNRNMTMNVNPDREGEWGS